MKLTLQNFENFINAVILQRGSQYYNSGAVLDIDENDGSWTAEVEGSDTYTVTISLVNDQEISEYFCDCPYDGDICKHTVAVLFALRKELKIPEGIAKKQKKTNQFEDLLTKIDAQEYREFAKQYASKNKDFKIAFELFFADKDDRINIGEKYTELIRKLIKKHTSHGFVDYRSSSGLSNEVDKLIGKSHESVHNKNYNDAFAIAKAILIEMMEVITYCDDSNGSISGTIFSTIELISDIAGSEYAAMDLKEHIFGFLQATLQNRMYFDYGDFGYNLFSIFEDLALLLNKSQAFLMFIDDIIPKLTGEYDDYRIKFLKTQKIDFLKHTGREGEAEILIRQNMNIETVRQGEVNKAIDKKDFVQAKKLITDGIKIAEDEQHAGTVFNWEKELLRIAVLENDVPLIRQYCKQFAFDRPWIDKQYYNQLKGTYKKDEWFNVINECINEIIQRITNEHAESKWLNSRLLDALSAVYIEERYWDRLFALVKAEENIDRMLQFHSYLIHQYAAELLQLYLPALQRRGDIANDRSQYASLAGIMKKLMTDIPTGKEQIINVAQNLKIKYPRRPAMIEELNKLLK